MELYPTDKYWAISSDGADMLSQRWERMQSITYDAAEIRAAANTPAKPQNLKGVGLIRIQGLMEKQPTMMGQVFGDTSTVRTINALKAGAYDKSINSIMMVIDSPGGAVSGTVELSDAIAEVNEIKPVIAQVDGQAASAAYWAASQSSAIFAGRADLVGSIGVAAVLKDYSEALEQEGIKTIPITTGPYKAAGTPGIPITDDQIEDVKRMMGVHFDNFKGAVASGRRMTSDQVSAVADGRQFIGAEAVDNGLIDGIQTFQDTFRMIQTSSTQSRAFASARQSIASCRVQNAKLKAKEF
ncbi:MAG: hypothetical protein GY847_14185 [Proteobacteria bacterium]|nr:hypothetical protein [Pseudomonadota bacterium]